MSDLEDFLTDGSGARHLLVSDVVDMIRRSTTTNDQMALSFLEEHWVPLRGIGSPSLEEAAAIRAAVSLGEAIRLLNLALLGG